MSPLWVGLSADPCSFHRGIGDSKIACGHHDSNKGDPVDGTPFDPAQDVSLDAFPMQQQPLPF